jgi:hypothetical protein
MGTSPDALERTIRTYFDACNERDVDTLMSCMTSDVVHYFPAPQRPFRGASQMVEGFSAMVRKLGSQWTVDRVLVDAARREAVAEWTHFMPRLGIFLRGDEWYRFNEHGLITEIRAYYACPLADSAQDAFLSDFPYADRGYPMDAPRIAERET